MRVMLRFLYLKLDISNRPLIFLDHKQEANKHNELEVTSSLIFIVSGVAIVTIEDN